MGLTRSLQRELNDFFAHVLKEDYSIHSVTKGALTQSRRKLKPEAFKELNSEAIRTFYDEAPYLKWRNHRLLAVDGSTLELPDHPTIVDSFGTQKLGCKAAATRSMCRVSILFDVLNLTTLDGIMDTYQVGERDMLRQHLKQAKRQNNDLLLMDRGYAGVALFIELQHENIDFCCRIPVGLWPEAAAMVATGEQDKVVTFKLPNRHKELSTRLNLTIDTIECRLIALTLDDGSTEVLCTSLINNVDYEYGCFKDLYHCRWQIEEAYKLLKCKASLGDFSGKTDIAVKQDFQAKIFMMTICATISFPIEEKVREQSKDKRKYDRKINHTTALAFIKDAWIRLLSGCNIQKALEAMELILIKSCEIIRPNRSFSRDKQKRKSPPMNYKDL
jgi:hypothetical protein